MLEILRTLTIGLIAAAAALAAIAEPAKPVAGDPALEARVLAVSHDLRCLVCQNETIAASNADLAVDLRAQIRQQLQSGRSEDQIRDYMVQRYGEFVLYRPALNAKTVLLWSGPFVLLAAALAILWRQLRRRGSAPPLTAADRERARRLLQSNRP